MNYPTAKSRGTGIQLAALAFAGALGLASCSAEQPHEGAGQAASGLIASCALCHAADGMGIEARSAPRLSGLDAAYIERQLTAFADGRRGAGPGDTFGSQMVVIAQSIDPAARKEAASHYASLPAPATATTGLAVAKPAAFETCAACHGPKGEGIAATGAPRIAGQPAWYLEQSLRLFRDGARGTAADDDYGQQMAAASKGLSDADIAAVAVYSARLDANKN